MLDLSRKRIRNPIPNTGEAGQEEGGPSGAMTSGSGNSANMGAGSPQHHYSQHNSGQHSLVRSHGAIVERGQYPSNVELGYKSVDGLAHHSVKMDEEDEEEEVENDEDYDDE